MHVKTALLIYPLDLTLKYRVRTPGFVVRYAACETRLYHPIPPEIRTRDDGCNGNRNCSHLLGPRANKGTALVFLLWRLSMKVKSSVLTNRWPGEWEG